MVEITEQKESGYINWERPASCLEDEFLKSLMLRVSVLAVILLLKYVC